MHIDVFDAQGTKVGAIVAASVEDAQAMQPDGFTCQVSADQPLPPIDPCEWLLDVGPFFDRFGAAKMAVLTSAHPVSQAVIRDASVRKWIDLRKPDVAAGIDALIAAAVPGVTPTLKAAILDTPVTDEENRAVRKLFFSGAG